MDFQGVRREVAQAEVTSECLRRQVGADFIWNSEIRFRGLDRRKRADPDRNKAEAPAQPVLAAGVLLGGGAYRPSRFWLTKHERFPAGRQCFAGHGRRGIGNCCLKSPVSEPCPDSITG